MKYRPLREDELKELEGQFILFLSAQSIPSSDWENIKRTAPKRTKELMDAFSDVVFEKVLKNVKYLEFKTPKDFKTFYCEADKINLIGLRIEGETNFDFTKDQHPQEMLAEMIQSKANLKLYHASKPYKKGREIELFDMMESGALISQEGEMYKVLENLK